MTAQSFNSIGDELVIDCDRWSLMHWRWFDLNKGRKVKSKLWDDDTIATSIWLIFFKRVETTDW